MLLCQLTVMHTRRRSSVLLCQLTVMHTRRRSSVLLCLGSAPLYDFYSKFNVSEFEFFRWLFVFMSNMLTCISWRSGQIIIINI